MSQRLISVYREYIVGGSLVKKIEPHREISKMAEWDICLY